MLRRRGYDDEDMPGKWGISGFFQLDRRSLTSIFVAWGFGGKMGISRARPEASPCVGVAGGGGSSGESDYSGGGEEYIVP